MTKLGDTKICPKCGKTATVHENIDPDQQVVGRGLGEPMPPVRRVLVWRCESEACGYTEVISR